MERKVKDLYFSKEIDNESSFELLKEIIDALKDNVNVLNLYINSNGGSLDSALGICDYLDSLKIELNTFCIGSAYSGAMLLFLTGKNRIMTKHSRVMIHSPYVNVRGMFDKKEIDVLKNENVDARKRYIDYITKKTNIKQQDIDKIIDNQEDWYINARKSLNFGIATKIL